MFLVTEHVLFMRKVCSESGFTSASMGYKVKCDGLQFPDDLQLYDRDILDVDIYSALQYFDTDAAAKVRNFGKRKSLYVKYFVILSLIPFRHS